MLGKHPFARNSRACGGMVATQRRQQGRFCYVLQVYPAWRCACV